MEWLECNSGSDRSVLQRLVGTGQSAEHQDFTACEGAVMGIVYRAKTNHGNEWVFRIGKLYFGKTYDIQVDQCRWRMKFARANG
jgi:hypothetical protein